MSQRCVITIGNFDGVHIGHGAILASAAHLARRHGAIVKVLTFDPHPASVLRPQSAPPRLSSQDEKVALLKRMGADEVVVLESTRELLAVEPHHFIADIVAEHAPLAFVEGVDFRFGKGRAGDLSALIGYGDEFGFETVVVPDEQVALCDHLIVPVSSSLVRWLLSHGRVADAGICLRRMFELTGEVAQGEQRGRRIGVPTANLDDAAVAGRAVPADGVYAGEVEGPGSSVRPAAISVGAKPTFTGAPRAIEAHLLDFDGDLYGERITIRFSRWLREQQRFPSVAALKAQMARDIMQVRRLHEQDALRSLLRSPRAIPPVSLLRS